jgi:DNA-binding response OmpR family regulator
MERKITVLIAEDDLQLGFIVKDNLEEEGFEVSYCQDGETAWQEFQRKGADICLLDINMPSRDGLSLAKKIRGKSDVVPIIFLTAKSMQEDKLKGFKSGADDYITKPFDMEELLSRMNVFLRRNRMMIGPATKEYYIGRLKFIPGENRLLNGQEEIFLTMKESQLLQFFCMNSNKILKREEILTYVWGKNDYFLGRSMDVFIAKLRKVLKAEESVSIETIHLAGYRFNNPFHFNETENPGE